MKCPKCVREGTTSTVDDPGGYARTLMGVHRYWDADGRLHVHDPNWGGPTYRCSLGHRWRWVGTEPCPVGDFGGSTLTELPDAIRDVPIEVWELGPNGVHHLRTDYGWRNPD